MLSLAKSIYKRIKFGAQNFMACYYMKRYKRDCVKEYPVKVGFIVQMAEIWDKQVLVYEEMKKREEFEVFLLVVPPYDFEKKVNIMTYESNYFVDNYSEALKVYNENRTSIDIDKLELDYVFYQRPYDVYLPKELRSSELMKKVKCCYIPYGFVGADVFNAGNTDPHFFRNMYFTFLESEYMKKILVSKFSKNVKKGYQFFENIGYPALEMYLDMSCPTEYKSLLWTPRWSYDEKLGGSHFIEYKDMLIKAKKMYKDMRLTFRPHPLMFDELISKSLMSREEVDKYLELLEESGVKYDGGEPVERALREADILLTDFSSIIMMFFLTGKPIIYCPSQIELNEEYRELEGAMYIARSEEDINSYLKMLQEGNDYLKDKRHDIIEKKYLNNRGAATKIVDRMTDDFLCKNLK